MKDIIREAFEEGFALSRLGGPIETAWNQSETKVHADATASPGLLQVATAAKHALRSYALGNGSADLARRVANHLELEINRCTPTRESAQPCGCDAGAKHRCSEYPNCAAGKTATA